MSGAYAIAIGRFYEDLAERLLAGARRRSRRRAIVEVEVFDVPGAFELPLAASYAAGSGRFAGVACLGRGDPRRDRPLRLRLRRGRRGVMRVQLDTGVPCAFGVLTCETMEQALARSRRRQARSGPPRRRGGAGDGRRCGQPELKSAPAPDPAGLMTDH